MKLHMFAAAVSTALLAGAAASAQTTQPIAVAPPPSITLDGGEAEAIKKRPENRKNANDIICMREAELGTRLPRKKTCMTRGQMNDRRLHDRDLIERGQANRPDNRG